MPIIFSRYSPENENPCPLKIPINVGSDVWILLKVRPFFRGHSPSFSWNLFHLVSPNWHKGKTNCLGGGTSMSLREVGDFSEPKPLIVVSLGPFGAPKCC